MMKIILLGLLTLGSFSAFSQDLGTRLTELGVDADQPQVKPVIEKITYESPELNGLFIISKLNDGDPQSRQKHLLGLTKENTGTKLCKLLGHGKLIEAKESKNLSTSEKVYAVTGNKNNPQLSIKEVKTRVWYGKAMPRGKKYCAGHGCGSSAGPDEYFRDFATAPYDYNSPRYVTWRRIERLTCEK